MWGARDTEHLNVENTRADFPRKKLIEYLPHLAYRVPVVVAPEYVSDLVPEAVEAPEDGGHAEGLQQVGLEKSPNFNLFLENAIIFFCGND